MYFARRRISFTSWSRYRQLFRKLLFWGAIVGLLGNAIYATLIMDLPRYEPTLELPVAIAAQGVSAPLLMLFYISAICLSALHPPWGRRLQILAPVGRMALSNYLLQSIACTLIFYGYGLSLFGKVGAAWRIVLTLGIYLLQIPLSHWWMGRFLYGPAEWVWRSLTYGTRQPVLNRQA